MEGHIVSSPCWIVFVVALSATSISDGAAADSVARFQTGVLCHFRERMEYGYVTKIGRRSKMDCVRLCRDDVTCVGCSLVKNGGKPTTLLPGDGGVCYLHRDYVTNEECLSGEPGHDYYRKRGVCYNGGKRDEETGRCLCADSVGQKVGSLCTAYPRNCKDLVHAGYQLPYDKAVDLQLSPGHQRGVIKRQCKITADGSVSISIAYNSGMAGWAFELPWRRYEYGFKRVDELTGASGYWLGLAHIGGLIRTTAERSRLSIKVQFSGRNSGVMEFFNVAVGDSSQGYRLTYDRHVQQGRFADTSDYCLKYSNGTRFSTFDVDNDDGAENCAQLNGAGGWWPSDCATPCNLLGDRYEGGVDPVFSLGRLRVAGCSPSELAANFTHVTLRLLWD